jgi:hypothetical protein
MLRQSDPDTIPRPHDERPIGELVHDLIEDGKAYAKAEAGLVKAVAAAKVSALKLPVILAVAAIFILQAALNVLGVGFLLGLAVLIGPVLAGLLVFLVMAGIAGGLAWWAVSKAREDLK